MTKILIGCDWRLAINGNECRLKDPSSSAMDQFGLNQVNPGLGLDAKSDDDKIKDSFLARDSFQSRMSKKLKEFDAIERKYSPQMSTKSYTTGIYENY